MPDDTVIDGEVVALDEQGMPSFSLLQSYDSSRTPLIY
jgi:ATP-dependent DNA ligase